MRSSPFKSNSGAAQYKPHHPSISNTLDMLFLSRVCELVVAGNTIRPLPTCRLYQVMGSARKKLFCANPFFRFSLQNIVFHPMRVNSSGTSRSSTTSITPSLSTSSANRYFINGGAISVVATAMNTTEAKNCSLISTRTARIPSLFAERSAQPEPSSRNGAPVKNRQKRPNNCVAAFGHPIIMIGVRFVLYAARFTREACLICLSFGFQDRAGQVQ